MPLAGTGASVRVESYNGATSNPPTILFWSSSAIWNNAGDKAVLYNPSAQAVISACDGNGCPAAEIFDRSSGRARGQTTRPEGIKSVSSYSRKFYRHGFLLSEQEFRRTYDMLFQQMKKKMGEKTFTTYIRTRLRNGVVLEYNTIDGVFSQENIGASAVIGTRMHFADSDEDPSAEIDVSFTDPREEFEDRSIVYEVSGDDRDWVFITSSQLEERIRRTSRFVIPRFLWLNFSGVISYLSASFLFIGIGFALALIVGGWLYPTEAPIPRESINDIERAWESGQITDPIEAIIRIEKAKQEPETLANPQRTAFYNVVAVSLFALPISLPLFWYFMPPYVFYWGENIKRIDRRQNAGKFILIGIILTVLLSVASNYVYDSLRPR